MFGYTGQLESLLSYNPILLFILIAWTLYWKGMALWKSSHLNHQKWFIAMLILNTLGILEILYLYVFSKKSAEVVKEKNVEQNPE